MNRILLIAADPGESALAAGRLDSAGHHVVVAAGGSRALALARAESFGLVLLNAVLHAQPHLGEEATNSCRELVAASGPTPVVVFSSEAVPLESSKALYEAGAAAVICTAHRSALERLASTMMTRLEEADRDIIPAGRPAGGVGIQSPSSRVPGTHLPGDAYSGSLGSKAAGQGSAPASMTIGEDDPISFDHYERKVISRAIAYCTGDKLAAADLLGIGKSTLYRKIKKLGLS